MKRLLILFVVLACVFWAFSDTAEARRYYTYYPYTVYGSYYSPYVAGYPAGYVAPVYATPVYTPAYVVPARRAYPAYYPAYPTYYAPAPPCGCW